ncbi:efflux RND transporter permease subunit [Pelistega suis]|uniref:MMPL family transporter n=1 Tax=Pelistega suis TaxID=1631957 RepID=A0A849PBQ2_9BURK|nr:efflux RND transporter permease subunit [Pelistega suis]NOL52327.1 MMPL family transporter [Pelistega suis]
MSFTGLFIHRPIATTLLALAMSVMGVISYFLLPVAPLPQMSIPMIFVQAQLSGASAENMASSIATPLERSLGSISGLSSMSSNSSEGSTRIFLEFDINKDIDAAAQEVQGAINAARPLLPSSMKTPPSYRKLNPSSMPIMALALTSTRYDQGKLYDLASTILSQKLSQIEGVGEVSLGGSSLPAVRVDLNPYAVAAYGVTLAEVRQAISQANTLSPAGLVENEEYRWQIKTNGKLNKAVDFRDLVIRWQGENALKLKDVANVYDYIESEFNSGFYNNDKAVNILIRREERANIIKTVDSIKANIEELRALLPDEVTLSIVQDRSPSIRATLHEAELTLIIAIGLVIFVVWFFLGNWRATLIPAISVPVSLLGTFIAIYLLGYSLNTISLMALIVATGFVVDDSIVVLENIMRYIEKGMSPYKAALQGAKEVGFTVLSMSVSLIAVFIPLLLMNNLIGVLFKEFAMTLSLSILVSLLVSLTLTPSLCSRWLRQESHTSKKFFVFRWFDKGFEFLQTAYQRSLRWALKFKFLTLLMFLATIALNVYMFITIPKGTFPTQDTGVVMGFFRVDQGTSFQAMLPKLDYYRKIIVEDPNVETVMGYAGGRGGSNSSFLMIQLKPIGERTLGGQEVINNLRRKFGQVPGTQLSLVLQQDIRMGGGPPGGSTGSQDLILKASDLEVLREWTPKVKVALEQLPELKDVMQGTQDSGRRFELQIDRDAVKRLGVDMSLVTGTLGNLFGSSQVSVIYEDLNQYYVVMSAAREFSQDPNIIKDIVLIASDGAKVPLSSVATFTTGPAPASVRHQGLQVSDSVSYNLAEGITMQQANQAVNRALELINLPTNLIQVEGGGDMQLLQQSTQQQPLLILAAIVVMYIVLGILYESFVLPLTILSTLPSAGVGALAALMLIDMEFTLIALIGVFLLIGIVKKNAIMMVDFAVSRERELNETPEQAIFEACVVRFRPIMMTTVAAIFGAVPLIVATGAGVEMRQPLGVTIVGGLILSQILTLYSTPVIYLLLDKMRHRFIKKQVV